MQHIKQTIEDLRRYIRHSDERAELEEVDTLLSVALDGVKRKLAEHRGSDLSSPPSEEAKN